jgi:hypothetical protein
MNGRVYDYNIGRFYSVDPVIQAPGNSQSLNPYSYIMNNPLAGTDPTGYTAECVEQCPAPSKRSEPKKRSGRSFVQDWYQYEKPNNGANTTQQDQVNPQTPSTEINSEQNKAQGQGAKINNEQKAGAYEKPEELGFKGEQLTNYPSTLLVSDGEERDSFIDYDILYEKDIDTLTASNWRSSLSIGGELPDFGDLLAGQSIAKTINLRVGSPISFGGNVDVDVHSLKINVQIFKRVRVDVVTKHSHTLWKARDPSTGEIRRGSYPNIPEYITTRTLLEGTYIRYKMNTGQLIGTMSIPTPIGLK